MIYPSPDILDVLGSKYALVIVAAKRAKQIKDHARRLVDTNSINTLTVALEEIAAGEIIPVFVGEPEKLPTSLPPTPVLGGLNASVGDEDEFEHGHDDLSALLGDEPIIDESPLGMDIAEDGDPLDVEMTEEEELEAQGMSLTDIKPVGDEVMESDLEDEDVEEDDEDKEE
jgi:DNA-directed RNA polymerase subunit omega